MKSKIIVEPAKRAIASTDYGCRPLRGLGLHSDMFLGFRLLHPRAGPQSSISAGVRTLRCHALRALDCEGPEYSGDCRRTGTHACGVPARGTRAYPIALQAQLIHLRFLVVAIFAGVAQHVLELPGLFGHRPNYAFSRRQDVRSR